MRRVILTSLALLLSVALVVACDDATQIRSQLGEQGAQCSSVRAATLNNGALPEGCVKTEGAELGQTGIPFTVGAATVTIDGWQSKDGEEGEYIGFTYTVTGDGVVVSVKAGGESHLAE